jgi:hypothetical protein
MLSLCDVAKYRQGADIIGACLSECADGSAPQNNAPAGRDVPFPAGIFV